MQQNFRCLEILRLNGCKQLKRAPNFAGAHSLKTLSFDGCSKFVELSQSIGDLQNLVKLDTRWCRKLRALPNSICKLKSLKCLNLEGCSKIKELPTNLGKLEQLCMLNARGTSISDLPSSFGSLRYLNYVALGQKYPFAEWNFAMEHNECLTSSNANLFPFYGLGAPYQCLQHMLQLHRSHGSYLASLLTHLHLNHSNFDTIPFGLCNIPQLYDLRLNNCQNLRVIQNLPPSLLYLSAKDCPLLEKVQDLSGLSRLQHLVLPNCSNLVELRGVDNLVYNEEFDIRNCSALTSNSWTSVNLFKVSDPSLKVPLINILGSNAY